MESDVAEAGGAKLFGHRLTPYKLLDAAVEVGVGGGVFADLPADDGHYFGKIKVVKKTDDFVVGVREFENQKLSLRVEYALHLVQPEVEVGEVADAVGAGDGIEMVIGVGEGEGAALLERDAGGEAGLPDFVVAYAQHLLGEVDADDLLHLVLSHHFDGEVGGAGGHVEGVITGCKPAHGTPAPPAVGVKREQVVEPVVGARDAVEEVADVLLGVVGYSHPIILNPLMVIDLHLLPIYQNVKFSCLFF